jgi:hypothetical protein
MTNPAKSAGIVAAEPGPYDLITLLGPGAPGQAEGSKLSLATPARLQIFLSNEYSLLTS